MAYKWEPNIRCQIIQGKAVLSQEDKKEMGCNGYCTDCKTFLGVDISMTGSPHLDGCCSDKFLSAARSPFP